MKIIIILKSFHQKNTLKVAQAMNEEISLEIINVEDAENIQLDKYDLIGFGSGIYSYKHHSSILKYVKNLKYKNLNTFTISTSGVKTFKTNNRTLRNLLKKDQNLLGSFSCLGLDKFFVFKLLGGINKGRPNQTDLENAKKFIKDIVEKVKQIV